MAPPKIISFSRIRNAVIFPDFKPANDVPSFQQKNLIYGFNGSGKTTLTRLLTSVVQGTLNSGLPPACEFAITLDDGTIVTQIDNHDRLKDCVRVYSSDFVDANFKWAQGQANPVFYIGQEQADAVSELHATEVELEKSRAVYTATKVTKKNTEKALATFKTDLARDIEVELRQSRKYRAPNLKDDFANTPIEQLTLLSIDDIQKAKETAGTENPLDKLVSIPEPKMLMPLLQEIANTAKKAATTQVLAELDLHGEMEPWLRHGFSYHQEHALEACLLCTNTITRFRFDQLSSAFDDAYNNLLKEINSAKTKLGEFQTWVSGLMAVLPEQAKFAASISGNYSEVRGKLSTYLEQAMSLTTQLAEILRAKEASLKRVFSEDELPALDKVRDCDQQILSITDLSNSMVAQHNQYHDNFLKSKSEALTAIRLNYLAANRANYNSLLEADTKADEQLKIIEGEGKSLRDRADSLKASLQNHATAAKSISKLVNNFLSHKEICIEAVDGGYELRRRDGSVIKSLSEGEKRAITFCYFLATLGENGKTAKDFIVVIDDPISSLDTKALNYTSCLIRNALDGAGQLFVLTHNLHFMHEMRKWIAPKGWVQKAKETNQPIPLYFIESRQRSDNEDRSSAITSLPVLLREHESEYHYLYSVVLGCANGGTPATEFLYLLPNAMRKVLEVFLSFKAPGGGGLKDQLKSNVVQDKIKTANGDVARFNAVERLAEIESHGDSLDPLTELPLMTIEETHQSAIALLQLISLLDPDHSKQMGKICERNPAQCEI